MFGIRAFQPTCDGGFRHRILEGLLHYLIHHLVILFLKHIEGSLPVILVPYRDLPGHDVRQGVHEHGRTREESIFPDSLLILSVIRKRRTPVEEYHRPVLAVRLSRRFLSQQQFGGDEPKAGQIQISRWPI